MYTRWLAISSLILQCLNEIMELIVSIRRIGLKSSFSLSLKSVQFTQIKTKMISTLNGGKVDLTMMMTMQRTKIADVIKTAGPRRLKALTLPHLMARNLSLEASRWIPNPTARRIPATRAQPAPGGPCSPADALTPQHR